MLEMSRAPAASEEKEMRAPADPGDMAFISGVINRQRGLIATFAAAGIALGALVYAMVPPVYKSTAVVLIDFKRLAAVDENFSTGSGRIDSSAVLSQLELMNSESVIRRVVQSEHLDQDPEFGGGPGLVDRLKAKLGLAEPEPSLPSPEKERKAIEAVQKALVGERIDLSYTISVTFSARTGEKAARLANAIAQAYITDQLEAKRVASEKASQWFTQRIADLQNEVSTADTKVVNFRREHNIVTADGKFINEEQISDLSQKLLQAKFSRAGAEAKVAQLKKIIDTGQANSALADEFSNQVVIDLRNKLLDASRRAADFASRYGEDHKSVVDLRAKMADLQNSINDQFSRIYEAARTDAAIAKAQVDTLQAELNTLGSEANEAREARAQLATLESSAAALKSIHDTFMSRYVDGIQKQSFPMTEARVISEAQPTLSPSFPTPFKTIGAGLAIGFGGGFLIGLAREAFTRRIRFSRQIRQVTGKPFLGFLPLLASRQRSLLQTPATLASMPQLFVETLRNIKINGDLERQGQSAIITFVSPTPGEGTSTVSAAFAALCARGGWRTLLIDLNYRNPAISRALSGNGKAGLSDILAGTAKAADVIVQTADANLHILPGAGSDRVENPGDLLSAASFRTLMTALRGHYRYIVIDAPALGVVADTDAVALVSDDVVMVVEWNETELHVLSQVLQNNTPVREKVIGTVLNKAPTAKLVQLGELHRRNARKL